MGRLRRGHGDPTLRFRQGSWWWAAQTADGPALLELARDGDAVRVRATGDGAGWALAQAPVLVGAEDRPEDFSGHPALAARPALARVARRAELRVGGTGLLADAIAKNVIEQKVTGVEAFTGIRRLVRRHGVPAPGTHDESHPAHGVFAGPTAQQWAAVPSWEFLQAGVDERRASVLRRTMVRVPALERVLERCAGDPVGVRGQALENALRTVPGIGPWTAAKVRQQVLGDPDAWSVDDYHVPGIIASRLGGEASEALEPFRPHRFRVELLVMSLGMPERHGARRSLPTHLPVRGGWRGREPSRG